MATKAIAKTSEAAIAEIVDGADPTRFVQKITPESMRGVTIERIVTIDAGSMIRGEYLGVGTPVETTDPVTGEVRELGTHRFRVAPNVVLRVLDCHQLRRELPPVMGKTVRVMKLGQVNTRKGFRVNDYVVAPEVA